MVSPSSNVDCASCSGACGFLAPDPDVAGLGVVIAFLTTSSLTWLCAVIRILHWFLNYNSSPNKVDLLLQEYHSRKTLSILASKTAPPASPNLYPFSPITRSKKSLSAHIARLSDIISPLLLSLHDTQLASGLAISATALIRSRYATFSVYHFSIAADLAWIASGTQIVSFMFVHSDIKEDQIALAHGASTHRIVQTLRASCMLIQMVLLLWLSYIQGEQRWATSYACPISCLENHRRLGGTPLKWMIANFVLVIWTYPVTLLPLCQPAWSRWKDFKAKLDVLIFKRPKPNIQNSSNSVGRTEIVQGIITMLWALLGSMALEVLVELGWFTYGVWGLVADRKWGDAYFLGDHTSGNGCDPVHNAENDWGFGQIFPVMILIVFFMTYFQEYGDVKIAELVKKQAHSRAPERPPDTFLLLETGAWASTIQPQPQFPISAPLPVLSGLRTR